MKYNISEPEGLYSCFSFFILFFFFFFTPHENLLLIQLLYIFLSFTDFSLEYETTVFVHHMKPVVFLRMRQFRYDKQTLLHERIDVL